MKSFILCVLFFSISTAMYGFQCYNAAGNMIDHPYYSSIEADVGCYDIDGRWISGYHVTIPGYRLRD